MSAAWPPERIAVLERLYLASKSYSQIGAVLGVSKERAWQKVQQLGWAPREKQGSPGNPGFAGAARSREQVMNDAAAVCRSAPFRPITIRQFSWQSAGSADAVMAGEGA